MILDLKGDFATDTRPARKASGRKPWAKDPTTAEANDGTRLDATTVNDLIALFRSLMTSAGLDPAAGDDEALANAIAAIANARAAATLHDDRYYTEAEVDDAIIVATTSLAAAIAAKAPLASPSLTGTPIAPTASPGTETTQIATTAFVGSAIAAMVAGAPGMLDTLDEIAAAIGDDENFAATVTNALAGKLAKASNLGDLTDTSAARTNLGLGALAMLSTITASLISDATSNGRSLITAADYAAMRGLLSLGSAALLNVGTSASNVVQLDGSARLPAVDGSQLFNVGTGLSFSTQAQAEAGTDNATVMTPLRTRQSLLDLMTTVSLIALQVADQENVALFLGDAGNRVFDSFDALTYIDAANSTNENTAAAGLIKPTVTIGADQIPTMTAATTSGVTMSASTENGGAAWRAGNKNTTDGWGSGSGLPQWIKVAFGSAKNLGSYSIQAQTGTPTSAPKSWVLQASATGAFAGEEVTVDTQSGIIFSASEIKSFELAVAANYQYFRLYITENYSGNGTNGIAIYELTLNLVGSANNMTLLSTSFSAAVAPSKMKALLLVKEVDAAAAGTDYTFELSRNGGTNFATATLTELFTSGGLRVVETNEVDVSGQPSATSPRWRFKNLNNKLVELHAVALYWGS